MFLKMTKKKVSCDEVRMEDARCIRLAKFHGIYNNSNQFTALLGI